MIASIDSTSERFAKFDIGRLALSSGCFSNYFQNFPGGVVAGNSADRAAAERARSTEKNIFPFSLDSPFPGLLFRGRERPGRRILKNIAVIHAKGVLDVDRAFAFDAQTAVARDRQAIFERFLQPLIHA